MCNEDGSVWVVFNGEIYNFIELRRELEGHGHVFKSNSDTEVIAHGYEQWDEDVVGRLRGMFAIAAWDERRQKLLLARDRVGIKPLYYTTTRSALLFASELKAILSHPSAPHDINPRAIDRFLTYYYVPGRETLIEGIQKLEPGHLLTVADGAMVKRRYWDLEFRRDPRWKSLEDAEESLRELLQTTVKDHMISDVPVGVLLSGGVDSTAVVRYAVEQTTRPISTFTVGFDGANVADERPYARIAANRYGTRHHEITFAALDFREFLSKYVWHMEEPVCEPPAVALYFVARLAREQSVKVLLSGEGGDEAFAGYETYPNLLMFERLKTALGPARGLLRGALATANQVGCRRAGRYKELVDKTFPEYYQSRTATSMTPFTRSHAYLYKREFADHVRMTPEDEVLVRLFKGSNRSVLDQMLYVDTKTWLPDDLLLKADKMTMATSVELRVPLLDHRVLEFAASLPPEFKVKGRFTKRILNRALERDVPPEILKRKKAGFPVPYEAWLTTDLRDFVWDTLMGSDTFTGEYLQKEEVRRLLTNGSIHRATAKDVFSLLILEMWHRQFGGSATRQLGVA
jgi:asparagine synthase (glutamine-hydrolysing)